MANEYLKRTPTSAGNRKVWTWAGWLKPNFSDGNGGSVFASDDGTNQVIIRFGRSGDVIQVGYWNGSSYIWDLRSSQVIRDCGSWYHLIVSVDTTSTVSSDRIKLYLNGNLITDFTTETYPSINFETIIGKLQPHGVGAMTGGSNADLWPGNMTDLFFVDGQALTPDVFGYYKKGDGYISAGSTQATDFKKGQWVPKAPKVIKSVINARGGFGVNGFYLPMNDSTNVGADLHCAPNSIIKLKGEDEPQPYYGAPTTIDAYVSQLRTDPYKDNLVVAVPGISTATGANLVTNSSFDSNLTGWTVEQGTVTWSNGSAQFTGASGNSLIQDVTTVVGKRYTMSAEVTNTANTANNIGIELGETGDLVYVASNTILTGTKVFNTSFTATSTSTEVRLWGGTGATGYWTNVTLKQEDAPLDYSADIKGSGTNKTLTANGQAGVGYEIPSYYGSAMQFNGNDDNFDVASSGNDYLIGQNDFTIEGWYYSVSHASTGHHKRVWYLGEELSDSISLNIHGGDADLEYRYNDGVVLTSGATIPTGQWVHIVLERYNRRSYIYVNGKISANGADSNYLDYRSNNFRIGQNASTHSNGPASSLLGYAKDVRFYNGVAKYKGVGFDIVKPYTPVGIATWRAISDTTANNFATLNPIAAGSKYTITEGSLRFTNSTSNWTGFIEGTVGFSTGKWYWETRADVDSDYHHIGIVGVGITHHDSTSAYKYAMSYQSDGRFYGEDNNTTTFVTGKTHANYGDIVQVAVDMNDKKMWIGINGNWIDSGDPATGTTENFNTTVGFGYQHYVPFYDSYGSSGLSMNFGQNPTFGGKRTAGTNTDDNGKGLFAYDVPEGYLALCGDNLPTPAIADPGKHFKTVLWTGDGNSGRSIVGVGFTPDLVWIKERTSTSSHQWHDSVRGAGTAIFSNSTAAESYSNTYLYSLDSDGFTLGTSGSVNASTDDYVAWCWRAGAGTTSANTDGSINSVVSVNQTAGFSIVSYTGTGSAGTVGHGLGKAPSLIITKHRAGTSAGNVNWNVCTSVIPGGYLELNTTAAHSSNADRYVTAGTNTNSFPGGYVHFNDSNRTYISYCWAEIEGYSKFGSYTGNGDADGPFVYCGFKPAWVLIKQTNDANNWHMADSSRKSINPVNMVLRANLSNTESPDHAAFHIDFLSNGFKLRSTNDELNENTSSYIFAAFAESPFTTANAK